MFRVTRSFLLPAIGSTSRRYLANRKMTDKLVWIDCEMTGLDLSKDTLLEVALIITDTDLIQLDSLDSLYISTPREKLDSMGDWCKNTFAKNGLTEKCLNSQVTLQQVDIMLDDFMVKNNIKNGILAGNSIGTDRQFLDKYCPKFVSHLHYRMVDVSSVKVLVASWYKDTSFYNKQTEHRALSDIMQSIDELRYYRSNYFKSK